MRIAVLSDTHDRVPLSLAKRMLGADEIWHLGDVCDPLVLIDLEQLGVPVTVVRGNCDSHFPWPIDLRIEREGVEFYLTHIPPQRAPPGVQVLLHGHTHVPRDEVIRGVRWLNPGCISQPRGLPPSFAWLEMEAGRLTRWELVRV